MSSTIKKWSIWFIFWVLSIIFGIVIGYMTWLVVTNVLQVIGVPLTAWRYVLYVLLSTFVGQEASSKFRKGFERDHNPLLP